MYSICAHGDTSATYCQGFKHAGVGKEIFWLINVDSACRTHFVSSWMRFASTIKSRVASVTLAVMGRDGGGDSLGLGWVKVNGNSAVKSLESRPRKRWIILRITVNDREPYPLNPPRMSFTFTRYCTMMPRFSFCTVSIKLQSPQHNGVTRNFKYTFSIILKNLHCTWGQICVFCKKNIPKINPRKKSQKIPKKIPKKINK